MKSLTIMPLLLAVSFQSLVLAEVIPDQTLGSNGSTVTQNQLIKGINSELVSGGNQQGSTLFHSLSQLNINLNNAVYFSNPTNINLIITRITGDNSSLINGTLGVLGPANLFLINPRGIIFGKGAKLDLDGSFLVTTADSVVFPGYEFSATKPNPVPLLKSNIPIGLNFTGNSGVIRVNNVGFQIYQPLDTTKPASALSQPSNGLSVNPGQSLSIIGGENQFDGSIINSVASNLNISAVHDGFVGLNYSSNGLSLDYSKVLKFGDIKFDNNSFISVNGFDFGQISIYGNNIDILGNSVILLNNVGFTPIGDLSIVAKNNLTISGNPNEKFPPEFSRIISGVISNTNYSDGANIKITAKNFIGKETGIVLTRTTGDGRGGNIFFNIEDSAQIIEALNFPTVGTTISTATSGSGASGNIDFYANTLDIRNGSVIGTASYDLGRGGNINIFVNRLNIFGYNAKTLFPSSILAVALNKGNGGNITINAKDFSILKGGKLSTNTRGSGTPGNIKISSDILLISGSSPSLFNGSSGIFSAASSIDPNSNSINPQINFDLSNNFTDSGNIDITAGSINIFDNGTISTQNDSNGNGGRIFIKASDKLFLKDSSITASTQGGDGGTINITTTRLIAQNSLISASARGSGNGGNISITSDVIYGDRNSYLRANAENGRGGDITVDVNGLSFPRENITAISTSGANRNGKVNINATNTTLSLLSLYKPPNVRYSFSTTCKPDPRKSLSVHGGSGMVPEQFNEPIETAIHAKNTYYRLDLKTRKKIPLGEAMLSWRDNGDGTGSPVSELPDPLSIASIPAFHCFDSSPVTSAKIK